MTRHLLLGLIVFFSISSKKCLKHFIMKPIGLSGEIDLKVKVKLQLKLMIPLTPWPSAAWAKSYWWTLEMGRVCQWNFWWVGLARAASPGLGLGLLPWPVAQKYDLSKSPLVTSGLTPTSRLLWAIGWVESLFWVEVLPSLSNLFHQRVQLALWWNIWDIFGGNTKENYQSQKQVSGHIIWFWSVCDLSVLLNLKTQIY